jgi:hypothetical protein
MRAQQVSLAGGWCAAAHINPTNHRPVAENDGATGACFKVGIVPHAQARDVSNIVVHDETSLVGLPGQPMQPARG